MTQDSRQIAVFHPGREGEPVAVVDGFFPLARRLAAVAPRRPFAAAAGYYPGQRSPAPNEYLAAIRALLAGELAPAFGIAPETIRRVEASYSLVSRPPASLAPMQRVPHFDTPRREGIACVHYLFPEDAGFGGTSFYRHNSTGYESVDATRVDRYMAALEAELARDGLPEPPRYVNGDTPHFTRILSCRPRFNRALFYRACRLHSGDILPDHDFSAGPAGGRLTMTAFIHLAD